MSARAASENCRRGFRAANSRLQLAVSKALRHDAAQSVLITKSALLIYCKCVCVATGASRIQRTAVHDFYAVLALWFSLKQYENIVTASRRQVAGLR